MVITDINQLDVMGLIPMRITYFGEFKGAGTSCYGVSSLRCLLLRERYISGYLTKSTLSLMSFFRNKTCRVYPAPFDVRIPAKGTKGMTDNQIYTIVQPDLCVVCDLEKIDGRGCVGAPDLVVEILSPSNSRKDLKDKYEIYQEQVCPNNWIVDADDKAIYQLCIGRGYLYRVASCL